MKTASFLFLGALLAAPTYAQCTGGPDGLEDNDDCGTAVAVPGNSATALNVEAADLDFYTVTVPDGQRLTVDTTFLSANGDIDTYIWDPLVACDSQIALEGAGNGSLAQGFTGTDNETMVYTNTTGASQDLIIEVRLWSGTVPVCNDYDIDIALDTPAPIPSNCVQTTFVSNNGGGVGGAVYFDLTASQNINLESLQTNYSAIAGTAVGIELWTTPGTHVGVEADPSVWTLAGTDNGTAVSAGLDMPTEITLAAPVAISTGTVGIALVAIGSAHSYTNGTGANQTATSGDGTMTINAGSATNAPFIGAPFTPRVWNGRLCRGGGVSTIGSPFCMANNNSNGVPSLIGAIGSTTAADNNVTLTVSQVPVGQFGIFTVAPAAGAMTPVNQGILCLSGPTGRYSMPGQIWSADAMGDASLPIDLTAIPTPTALVPTNPGDTWFFQAWHRDIPPAGAPAGSNFTTGVEITFN